MPDIVNGLLIQDSKVLLARRSPLRRNYPGSWSFPGGHVEPGETLEQALHRELDEEIGVTAKSWKFLCNYVDHATRPLKPVHFHFFAVEDWTGQPKNLGDEHSEIRWVDFTDVKNMPNLAFSWYGELVEPLSSN